MNPRNHHPGCTSSAWGNPIVRGGRWFVITVLRGYQYILSPLFPPSCRFTPTCSAYAIEAISRLGICRGAG